MSGNLFYHSRQSKQPPHHIMSPSKILAFQLSLPVRWADMDVNAHVNNTRFFTYFESARLAWLESVRTQDQRDGQGLVVAQAACNFRRPIPYPETVRVNLYAGRPGRSSFTTYYDLFSAGDESIQYADGKAVMVWVDRASGKSLPIPDYVRSALASSSVCA
jgi:acyl-CoA thioester hydrolase